MKKKEEETGPEKFFAKAISEYFSFHKSKFTDDDGFALSPDWNGVKRGMELKSLKLLLETLRTISERKNFEWTEEKMVFDFRRFMEKCMLHNLVRKDFRVSMMNRFKIEILSSSYNPELSKKILTVWYELNPDYTRVFDKDKISAEKITAFFKTQYALSSVEFSEQSVLASARLIFETVKEDQFWSVKPLRAIANNMQEFVNKIKQKKNEKSNSGNRQRKQFVSSKTAGQEVFADRLRDRLEKFQ